MEELQRKKLERLFMLLDTNGDGSLEAADYAHIGDQVARLHGLAADSPAYQQMRERMQAYWQSLVERTAPATATRLSRDEWLASMGQDSGSLQQARAGMVGLAAVLLDRNGDGQITVDDYRMLLQQLGQDLAAVETVFARLDQNGDGQIDQAELERLIGDFLHSSDPAAAGNWLLGPI